MIYVNCQLFVNLNSAFCRFDDDFVHRFFIKYMHVTTLGYSILKSTQMRTRLNDLLGRRKQTLIGMLQQQSAVNLVVDETTVSRGRHILNIIVNYFDLESAQIVSLLLKSVELVALNKITTDHTKAGKSINYFQTYRLTAR